MANTQPSKPVSETVAVKKALKEAGYTVKSSRFGRGTARNWIHVEIVGPWTEREFGLEHYAGVYALVKRAAGRDDLHDDPASDLFVENITVQYEQEPAAVAAPDAPEQETPGEPVAAPSADPEPAVDGAPYEAPVIEGVSDVAAWLEDQAALEEMEYEYARAAFAARADVLGVEAAPKKRRGGRKSKAEKAAEEKAHLPVTDLANLIADIRGFVSQAKVLAGDIRSVYGEGSAAENQIQMAMLSLRSAEGEVSGDMEILLPCASAEAEDAGGVF